MIAEGILTVAGSTFPRARVRATSHGVEARDPATGRTLWRADHLIAVSVDGPRVVLTTSDGEATVTPRPAPCGCGGSASTP